MSLTGSESDGSFQACLQLLAGDLFRSYFPPRVSYPSVQCSERCVTQWEAPSGTAAAVRTNTHLPVSLVCSPGSNCMAVIGQKEKKKSKQQDSKGTEWLFCDFCAVVGPKPALKPTATPQTPQHRLVQNAALIGARQGDKERKRERN